MMIWFRRIFIAFSILYVTLSAVVFFAQRKFLYYPPNDYHEPPANMTEVHTKSGTLGWYSPARNGQPTVMIFHGNASYMDTNLYIFRDLQAAGYGVWVVGYSGYPGRANNMMRYGQKMSQISYFMGHLLAAAWPRNSPKTIRPIC